MKERKIKRSSFTNFLNLFKWNTQSQEDLQEEFDIDRTLNDNWDKIDEGFYELNDEVNNLDKENIVQDTLESDVTTTIQVYGSLMITVPQNKTVVVYYKNQSIHYTGGNSGHSYLIYCYGNVSITPNSTNVDIEYQAKKRLLNIIDKRELADKIYPVGSIYMSVINVEPNPSVLFGGTWERIKDVFLLSAGDVYTAGDTGGEAEHTLVKSELPSNTAVHTGIPDSNHSYSAVTTNYTTRSQGASVLAGLSAVGQTNSQAHNNMPPYLVVHMWKRVS